MSAVQLIGKLPVDLLKIIEEYKLDYQPYGKHSVHALISSGNIKGLFWVYKHNPSKFVEFRRITDYAAFVGNINVLEWLYSNNIHDYTVDAIDNAARNSDNETVIWIHEHYHSGCVEAMIEWYHNNYSMEFLQCMIDNDLDENEYDFMRHINFLI
jgi:hypothetical protein